jgi:hypothetical protein
MKYRSILCVAVTLAALGLLWQTAIASSKPEIAITTVPPWDPGGAEGMATIAGRVTGDCKKCKVILYAHGDVWYVQPFENRTDTEIQRDGSWNNRTHLGTEYAALLTSADYRPLTTSGALPSNRAILASAVVAGRKQ